LKKTPGLTRGDIGKVVHFRIFFITSFNLKTILNCEEFFAVMPGMTRHLSLRKYKANSF
jgi:hypothetical protein